MWDCIILQKEEWVWEDDFIDRILNSGISFKVLHISTCGIIDGAGKNDTISKPVRGF
jgi:hypothetical protein